MYDAAIFRVLGAIAMLIGIMLFRKDKRNGANVIKIAGMEFSLSTPSLVIVLIGALLCIFPNTAMFRERPQEANTTLPVAPPTAAPTTSDGKPYNVPALAYGIWRVRLEHCDFPVKAIENIKKDLAHDIGANRIQDVNFVTGQFGETLITYDADDQKEGAEGIARIISRNIDNTVQVEKSQYHDPDANNSRLILVTLIGPHCEKIKNSEMGNGVAVYRDKIESPAR